MERSKVFDPGKASLFLLLACASLCACEGNSPVSNNKQVVETPIAGGFSNAELIRNPVSLDGHPEEGKAAVLAFADTLFDFGQVREGAIVEHTFSFVNTGKSPLLISRAYSTCGCTVPEWPEAPIPPRGNGVITVRFDTEGRTGLQVKPVTITANTIPASTKVYIKGEVLPL